MLTSMTFKNNVSTGDPMAGVEVKLGSASRGIIATSVSDKNGMVEFKNVPEGRGYYMDYGIKEKGIKGSEQPIRIEGIECKYAATGTINTATNRAAQSEPKVMTNTVGDIEITVTVTGNTIRGSINLSRSNIKVSTGTPINTSRSNIKNR